mmetsp:Transcript_2433/g.7543  ORF Transcript_2433/g.7543 Transcript_2433/m.7543 type:complete len:110 (+) Transcript_2433:98-427(+)
MIAVVTVTVLEGFGASAVPYRLFRTPVSMRIRIVKPLALGCAAYLVSVLFGEVIGTLCVLGHAVVGMLMHRKFCLEHGNDWVSRRSPYLYRNENQMRLWSVISSKLAGE